MSNFETQYTHEIVCPYCGYKFCDSWEMNQGEEGDDDAECPSCEREFIFTRILTVEYCTSKIGSPKE